MKKTLVLIPAFLMLFFSLSFGQSENYRYEIIKEGTGEKPVIGKEIGTHMVITTLDGTLLFDSEKMLGVTVYNDLTGEDKDSENFEQAMMLMNVGSVYKFTVSKDEMKDAPFYSQIIGDEVIIETRMLEINDSKPNGVMEIGKAIREEGIKAAEAKMAELLPKNGKEVNIREWDLNALGYNLMSEEMVAEAVAIFEMNVKMNPESANVYDSLGEGYEAQGKMEEAAKQYKKALEINPEFEAASIHLKELGEGE